LILTGKGGIGRKEEAYFSSDRATLKGRGEKKEKNKRKKGGTAHRTSRPEGEETNQKKKSHSRRPRGRTHAIDRKEKKKKEEREPRTAFKNDFSEASEY